jgi:hypothetical protein
MSEAANFILAYFVVALFLSVLDRYFSGEDYKKSEWINGKSFKFRLGLSLIIVVAPFLFTGFFTSGFFYAPFSLLGLIIGFATGDFFLKSYDWAFKKPAVAPSTDKKDEPAASDAGSGGEKKDEPAGAIGEDDKSRQSVVDAIQSAGSSIKEGLKSVGEGIAKASENVFSEGGKDGEKKEGEPKDKKNYESNKKLDDKLNNY